MLVAVLRRPTARTPGGRHERAETTHDARPTDLVGGRRLDRRRRHDDRVGPSWPGRSRRPNHLRRSSAHRSATGRPSSSLGFAGLIASLLVLGSIAEGVRDQEVFALDTWATPFLHGIASPGLDFVMWRLTDIGSSLVIVPALRRHRRSAGPAPPVWAGALSSPSRAAVASRSTRTMKLLFERPRPQLDYAQVLPDYSFPSGHTMNALVFYVALALIVWSVFGRRVGLVALVVALVLAFGVGVSRIYLGYHYLTDVVGGVFAGTAWLLVVGAAFRLRPTWWSWGAGRATTPPAARCSSPAHDGAGAGVAR